MCFAASAELGSGQCTDETLHCGTEPVCPSENWDRSSAYVDAGSRGGGGAGAQRAHKCRVRPLDRVLLGEKARFTMKKTLVWCAALLGVLSNGCGGSGGSTAVITPLSASATSVSFSTTQPVGTSTAIQTITLTNKNTSQLTLTSITLTGSNPASFAEASDCPTILSASASCTIWVTFGPTAAAVAMASVNVVSNATNSPTVVTLTGTGVA